MKAVALAFGAVLLLVVGAMSSCVVAPAPEPAGPVDGNIGFDWSFDGDTSCADANVTDLEVVVSDADTGDVALDDQSEPCTGGGLTVTGIPEGSYNVDITAFDHNGDAIYAGSFSADVIAGTTADAGLVDLAPAGPA